jgi:hypothetical protein
VAVPEGQIPRVCVLQRRLSAITVLQKDGVLLAGERTWFSEGTQLLVCGPGYDEHTLKVFRDESYYFVFSAQLKEALKHLSDADWLDFALELVAVEQRDAMQGHLDRGCESCEKTLDTWKQALELYRQEAGYNPPRSEVLTVKASFQAKKWWEWLPQIAEFARIVLDSSRHPVLAGVRGGAAPLSRHILQETDSFTIDLRLEREPGQESVRLTGQVLNSRKPSQRIQKGRVILLQEKVLVAEKTVSDSGEFGLIYDNAKRFQLFIDIPGQQPIGISLPIGTRGKSE